MNKDWQSHLTRWLSAGLIDDPTADRIKAWELDQAPPAGLRWPILIALTFGALLLSAGVLLFVSAHWDQLSPEQRMAMVVTMVAVFHTGGAMTAARFEGLSIALHTIGTVALGAGIALAGQIFHISTHWPAAIMLWAAGAAIAWAILRHWTQAALTAILIPYWLAGEALLQWPSHRRPIFAGLCALSFTYLSARGSGAGNTLTKALGWLGAVTLLPLAAATALESGLKQTDGSAIWILWTLSFFLPLSVAVILRRSDAIWNSGAIAWSLVLASISHSGDAEMLLYIWCAVGAVGLTAWGVHDTRPERINLGFAGFAITVLVFYFSNVMDKLDRSVSLIGLGVLFLGGGWFLERTRRRLVSRTHLEAI